MDQEVKKKSVKIRCDCDGDCVCSETKRGGVEMKQRDGGGVLDALLPENGIEDQFLPPPMGSDSLCQPSQRKMLLLLVFFLLFFTANSAVQTATSITQLKV